MTYEETIDKFRAVWSNLGIKDNEINEFFTIAIECIEKQIPKKPQEYELRTVSDEEVHYEGCPNCRSILNKNHYFLKICHCGQKLEV